MQYVCKDYLILEESWEFDLFELDQGRPFTRPNVYSVDTNSWSKSWFSCFANDIWVEMEDEATYDLPAWSFGLSEFADNKMAHKFDPPLCRYKNFFLEDIRKTIFGIGVKHRLSDVQFEICHKPASGLASHLRRH